MAKYTRQERIRKFGFEKVRAEQLNWVSYLTHGFRANLAHALKTNNFCLHTADIHALEKILANEEKNIAIIDRLIHRRKHKGG